MGPCDPIPERRFDHPPMHQTGTHGIGYLPANVVHNDPSVLLVLLPGRAIGPLVVTHRYYRLAENTIFRQSYSIYKIALLHSLVAGIFLRVPAKWDGVPSNGGTPIPLPPWRRFPRQIVVY